MLFAFISCSNCLRHCLSIHSIYLILAWVDLDTAERPLPPHEYWYMRIVSIHYDGDDKCWVIGSWYYLPSEVAGLKYITKK